jgi:hypothetical protein
MCNLGPDSGYPDFSSLSSGKFWVSSSTLFSHSFHFIFIEHPVGIQSEIITAS